jgi:wyosine [tRNA(Phe)-imidazoG37] synthetase (radical SAM superfamily)
MLNEPFYNELSLLKEFSDFKNILSLQEGKFEIEYHTELLLRYFILKTGNIDFTKYKSSTILLSEFIDNETVKLVGDSDFKLKDEEDTFKKTFEFLFKSLGVNTFKKYNEEKGKFEGAFLESSFEAIAPGVSINIDTIAKLSKEEFQKKIIELYKQPDYQKYCARGIKAIPRMKGLSEFSKTYFSK